MPENRPRPTDGLDVNEVRDGLVIYDARLDRVHYLNASAAVVFTLCDGVRAVGAIAEALVSMFGPDAPTLADIEACVARMEEEGVITSAP